MSFARDITIWGVITTIAIVVHFMAVELFAPGGVLYRTATDGTGNMNGTELASFWFEIFAVWVPALAIAGITGYVFVGIFRRQAVTSGGVRRGP